jgi:hypothetical protein
VSMYHVSKERQWFKYVYMEFIIQYSDLSMYEVQNICFSTSDYVWVLGPPENNRNVIMSDHCRSYEGWNIDSSLPRSQLEPLKLMFINHNPTKGIPLLWIVDLFTGLESFDFASCTNHNMQWSDCLISAILNSIAGT